MKFHHWTLTSQLLVPNLLDPNSMKHLINSMTYLGNGFVLVFLDASLQLLLRYSIKKINTSIKVIQNLTFINFLLF